MSADATTAGPLKLLVVHSELPHPDRDACSLRLYRILALLAEDGHRITFVGRGGMHQERYTAMLLALGLDEVYPIDPERFGDAKGWPKQSWSIPMLDVPDLLSEADFDVAWLSLYDVAEQYLPLLRAHSPRTRVIIDSSDIQWVREHRGAELAGDAVAVEAALRTRERERAVYAAADLCVAISEADAEATRELAPEVPTAIVGMAQSFETPPANPQGRDGLVFVGNFFHAPNVDAILDFHASVWPLVRQARPDLHLTIVGTAPPPEVQALAGPDITITGWVPSVEPYLQRARVSIAPLRFGAGVKGKIAEAIAAGLPVVTTSVGAEGMDLVHGAHALIEDEPGRMAAAIVRLCDDDVLWRQIATDAPVHLDSVMGAGVARAGIRDALRALTVPERACAPHSRVRRRNPRVAVALHGSIDSVVLRRQLQSLDGGLAGDDVDVLILAGCHHLASAAAVAERSSGRVLRCTNHTGRARFHELALEATKAPILVTLGPLALPRPGFLQPLVDSVAAGATFAGPVIDAAHGYRVAADGSLWPRPATAEESVQALAYDCLAATRETWSQAPLTLSPRDGHPEHQLAEWALAQGPLAVSTGSIVDRLDAGPVSVIICTRNRAEELPEAIGLLVACGATSSGSEIVIVDNASTDATAEVAAELGARNQGVRIVREERAGLSHARNAGARVARNEQLCYLDDDARPAPGWRESLAWALRIPGVAAAGGPVCGLWPAIRATAWPPVGLEGSLSVLDAGDVVRAMNPQEGQIVYGANWAIHREALRATGGFDAHLGYGPDVKIGGEEVAVAWRLHLLRIGSTLYVPGAAVGHRISEDRIRDSYIVERFFKVGIEHAHLRGEREGLAPTRLVSEANSAALGLLAVAKLAGQFSLEEALDEVQAAPVPLPERVAAAEALGLLAASVLLLGEQEVEVDDLRLTLRPENLRGVLVPGAAVT